jgi:RNA polymerase sigma-70 factor, ECF subfamily
MPRTRRPAHRRRNPTEAEIRPSRVPTACGRHPGLGPDLGPAEREYCFSVAMKYVRDEEVAADVAQEALLLAHRYRDSFRGDSRFSTWLYRIAATTALMWLRRQRRRGRELTRLVAGGDGGAEEIAALETRISPEPGPAELAAAHEQVHLVARRLDEMGDKYGRIFLMRYLEGYTETEIAERLDLSLATVKTRAHRARVAVKDTLARAA